MIKYYRFTLWVIVIGILCFTPGNDLREVKINIPHLDKVVHFVMFYILGLLISGMDNTSRQLHYILIGFGFLYAGIIEIVQYHFVAMRSGEILDFVFDLLGLTIGIISYKYYPKFAKTMLR